ncbi:DUF445 domain-containing protein [Sphingorhabdus sp. Alg239-R122]|uniref:DUF445 domain-containing protein n=1 Tax=Sphingorhabdus sp. Alg239-R122 TaxID=2305989 RepID=UPI0013D96F68|nr:DUF445 domain-containing protein [Sphingorhabdus sp. Alg239-R122]
MRMVATGLLILMALIFVIAHNLQNGHPAWGFIIAFSEAAMVGGLADWFAVTALFRHPMGVPIPHTAIIPTNKDRIADTMAQFLQENFLIPKVIARRVQHMNVAGAAGQFLVQPTGGEGRLRLGVSNLVADVLESLDEDQLGGMAKDALRTQLHKLDVAPLLGQILNAAIADGRHLPLMDSIIKWTAKTLEANEQLIRDMVHEKANGIMRFTGLDERLANAIVSGLHKLLDDMAGDVEHPLRHKVEEGLEKLAHDLVHDAKTQQHVQDIKAEMLANPAMGRWINGLWERARSGLLESARNPDGAFSGKFGENIGQLGETLQNDERMQVLINRFARRTLVGVATRYGQQIVQLVSETVRRWDARTITDRVETAVGRDLQFIRINGTLVGGLVGLTIHTVIVLLD